MVAVLNQQMLLKQFFLTRALLKHHLDGGIRKGANSRTS
jgi:hypothetical protein